MKLVGKSTNIKLLGSCIVILMILAMGACARSIFDDVSESGTRRIAGLYGRLRLLQFDASRIPNKRDASTVSNDLGRLVYGVALKCGALAGGKAADLITSSAFQSTTYHQIDGDLAEIYWALAISRYKVQLEQGLSELENVAGAPEILQNNERFNHVMRLCARIEQTIERKAKSQLNSSEELGMLLIFISGNAISLIIYFCVALVTVLLLISPLYFLAQRILKSRVIARYAIACAIGMSAGFAACCASFPEEIPSILTRPLIESERLLYDARWILFGAWLVNPGMGMTLSRLVIAISSLHLLERLGKSEIRS